MPYCRECGNQVAEGNAFCHECGAKITADAPRESYTEPQNEAYTYEAPQVSKRNAILSFILGLVNIELCIFALMPYACFIFFPACLVLSIIGIKKAKQYTLEGGPKSPFAIIGKITSIVSLVLACLFFVIGMMITFVPDASNTFWEAFFGAYGFDFSELSDIGGGVTF